MPEKYLVFSVTVPGKFAFGCKDSMILCNLGIDTVLDILLHESMWLIAKAMAVVLALARWQAIHDVVLQKLWISG